MNMLVIAHACQAKSIYDDTKLFMAVQKYLFHYKNNYYSFFTDLIMTVAAQKCLFLDIFFVQI